MRIENAKDLGLEIRKRRKQLKLTQKDLALSCGTGPRFIIDLEKGKATCQAGKTLEVLKALGIVVELTPNESRGGKS